MGDYTPTTEDVRAEYMDDARGGLEEKGDYFDRWLEAHDRQVAEKTLTEAAELIKPFSGIGLANGATRADVALWLRDRAAPLAPKPGYCAECGGYGKVHNLIDGVLFRLDPSIALEPEADK